MPKYHNKKEVSKVGKQIKRLRIAKSLRIGDISDRTGFATSTLSAIENGANTDTSHLIEIAKAIGVHPKELFDVDFEIKPRFDSKISDKKGVFLTNKLFYIVTDTDFFHRPRLVKDVIEYLKDQHNMDVNSTHVSVVLKRLVNLSYLEAKKQGRKNLYFLKRVH